jgi:hypothetical protein
MAYDYPVEDGVDVPEFKPMRTTPPFSQMKVGQSVVFDIRRRKVIQTMASRQKKLYGREFTCHRISDEEGRCWRIK